MAFLLADAYLHELDPFAIKFPSSWPLAGLRWYGLAYLAGFLAAWGLVYWLSRARRSEIPLRSVGDLMIYAIVGVVVGGRLGYCIFYDPSLLVDFSGRVPFWGLLAIHTGGMASHGGMIGAIAACLLFAARQHIPKLHLLDVGAFVCAPGLFFGRLANFVNAELWGRSLPASMQTSPPWWSIKYPQELQNWSTQKLADLGGAVEAVGLSATEWQRQLDRADIAPDAKAVVEATIEHIISAAQSGNEAVVDIIRPMLTAYYPSQILQALTDGPLLLGLMMVIWLRPRKPGVVGSWFLIGYGVMRIATELVRQPDEGVAVLATPLGDLTRGQLLSLVMVIAGIVALVICARRTVAPMGGLAKTHHRATENTEQHRVTK